VRTVGRMETDADAAERYGEMIVKAALSHQQNFTPRQGRRTSSSTTLAAFA
jgi:hypothetical protein